MMRWCGCWFTVACDGWVPSFVLLGTNWSSWSTQRYFGFYRGQSYPPPPFAGDENQHNNTQWHQSGKSQLVPGGYWTDIIRCVYIVEEPMKRLVGLHVQSFVYLCRRPSGSLSIQLWLLSFPKPKKTKRITLSAIYSCHMCSSSTCQSARKKHENPIPSCHSYSFPSSAFFSLVFLVSDNVNFEAPISLY